MFYDRNLPAGKDIWTRKPPGRGIGTISREGGSLEKHLWRDCPDKRGRPKKPKRNGCRIWLRIIFLENLRRRLWNFRQRNILWMERAGEKTPDKQRPGKMPYRILSRKLAKKPNRREAIPEGKDPLSQAQGICKRDLRRMSKVLGADSQKGGFALNSKRRQGHVYAVIPGGAGISRRL